jgi:hypothetical protein
MPEVGLCPFFIVSRSNYIILDGGATTITRVFFTNGIFAMKNPDVLRIFFPE